MNRTSKELDQVIRELDEETRLLREENKILKEIRDGIHRPTGMEIKQVA